MRGKINFSNHSGCLPNICTWEFEAAQKTGKAGIEYRLELPGQEVCIPTHRDYLARIIRNLLDNAGKFTREGRIVLELVPDKGDRKIRIRVTDTGCGIPADKQEYVFERFSKLDAFVQGNGLGLFLCRMIATRLGGTISIDPSYTSGARFEITLPA